MRILGFGGNQLAADGYNVDNSCRFDEDSNDNLTRTPSSSSNKRTFTFSFWIKQAKIQRQFITAQLQDTSNFFGIEISGDNEVEVMNYTSPSYDFRIKTTRKLRDPSAWYHIVASVDTTQSTSSNRVKIYVNGSQETDLSSSTYPSQNFDTKVNTTNPIKFSEYGSSDRFDGYITEVCFIDGQQLDATSFGEFDEDSGIWKPIDVSGLTFGTNGFYLDFENSGSLGADVSGNGNNFTVNNLTSIDQTTDTCTNNFATANPLQAHPDTTFQEGNTWTRQLVSANAKIYGISTIGVSSGKWYMEFKHVTNDNDSLYGITTNPSDDQANNYYPGEQNYSFGFLTSNGNYYTNGSGTSYGSSASSNDIIGVALDITNQKLYFSINGTWQNSGNPSTGSNGIDISGINTGSGFYHFSAGSNDTSNYDNPYWNFGNPAFTISSGNSDGNGYGNFEYAVPSGYYALNSKNLAEYG